MVQKQNLPKKTGKTAKKKIKKIVPSGIAFIHATFNNTIVSIANEEGNVLAWSSAGALGVRGSKKSRPYVAQLVSAAAVKSALNYGMKEIKVEVKGPGPGRDAAIKTLEAEGLKITSIRDVTPIPHNGVRPRKKPRK